MNCLLLYKYQSLCVSPSNSLINSFQNHSFSIQMMKPYQFRFALLTWLYLLAFFYNVHGQSAVPSAPVVAPHASGNNINPSLAIMVVVLVCAFLIMGFSSIYIRNCAESYAITQNPIGDCSCSCHGIDPKVLDTFPILVYSTIKDLKFGTEALECAVCLSEFKDNETLRLLPKCNHVFHPECIDTWLSSHVTCPLCRGNLKADCGEVAIVIPTQLNSHEVFDESSVRRAELGEAVQHAIVLNMNEGQRSGNSGANDMSHMTNVDGSQGHPPDSKIFGKYVRSHSTGHSLVERTKTLERHTLRLPEDVKKQILVNHGAIRRSSSYDVILAREESSGKACTCECDTGEGSSKGQKDGAERQSRWLLSMTPPFVSRGWNSATVSANASSSCSGFPRLWSSSSPPHEPL